MAHSESEDGYDVELDRSTDGEDDQERIEDDLLEPELPEYPSDGDEDSASENSEDSDDEAEADEESEQDEPLQDMPSDEVGVKLSTQHVASKEPSPQLEPRPQESPTSRTRPRSLSPAQTRKRALLLQFLNPAPRTYTVEATCAMPHPVPTHALSASFCMTHLLTGSDDGYIRDYDVFSTLNGKNFLTAPQRQHCGVVEGILKAGQLKFWWENLSSPSVEGLDEAPLSSVYSMITHSDALWTLAGSKNGNINLFTLRHEPGRLAHVMGGHRGPVSAMSMQHDEKGFFSAGWDGDALQWDLNTGQVVRKFTAHGAQLAGIAVRPLTSGYFGLSQPVVYSSQTDPIPTQTESALTSAIAATAEVQNDVSHNLESSVTAVVANGTELTTESIPDPSILPDPDAKSDISFDPLFDEDADGEPDDIEPSTPALAIPGTAPPPQAAPPSQGRSLIPPKNAPPLLDPATYSTFSPDVLMTASIDGQVILWDRRVTSGGTSDGKGGGGVGRLWMSDKTPPWCLSACWSADGAQIYAGRRNGAVDVWDVRQLGISGPSGTPKLLKVLKNPPSSGVVSCIAAFPDGRHITCASTDNIRLWNVAEAGQPDGGAKPKGGLQFKIIPGHHGGYVSQMLVDPAARFLVSASSNRGWHGDSTRTVFVHDVKHIT